MNLLQTWVETPLAGAIGWTLLHSLWEGAIVSATLAAALAVLRSPRARYAAACGAMLVMLGGFGVTLIRVMPEHTHGVQTQGTLALPAWNAPRSLDAVTRWKPSLAAVAPWLAPFWIAGVWIFYLRHLAGWIGVCRLRRRGVCCAPEDWEKKLGRLSVQLRLSRPVLLLESCIAEAPMVLGHFRPVILMPIGLLAGLPAEQIEAILLHELAHVRRYDYLVNVLQRAVDGLFFYHPAVWWISRVITLERENCCDDVVVEITGNAHGYAVALAALEQNRCLDPDPALAATGGSLMKRIRRLLNPKLSNSAWTPLFSAAILMAILAVALTAWQAAPQPNRANAQPQADAIPSPYDLWLNEDVAYIITDQERSAFQKLTKDEEKLTFIEQFWLRRDPTPGTAGNEYKEQYYRRIAYANERFDTEDLAGWQTDRGRIYIVWGPPDEIESHPIGGTHQRRPAEGGGTTSTFPFEDWRYRHVEGVGDNVDVEFVDKTRTGEFKMMMDPHEKETTSDPAGQARAFPISRPRRIFVSKEPGANVTVEISPDRRMLIGVPIDFDARQYLVSGTTRTSDGRTSRVEFMGVVSLCKNSPGTPACLEQPVFHPDTSGPGKASLDPGSYVFNASVKDLAGTVEKIYVVSFEVN